MGRRNPFIRVRRYDQWPSELHGNLRMVNGHLSWADYLNTEYRREMRRQSWRRPL